MKKQTQKQAKTKNNPLETFVSQIVKDSLTIKE